MSQAARAVLAARREWVTNEKTLDRAGLRDAGRIVSSLRAEAQAPHDMVDTTLALCESAVRSATNSRDGEAPH